MDGNKCESKIIRYSNLDVIKGICILMVVFTHYNWEDKQRLVFLFPFWIDMAVPIFMVVTGYVSAVSYKRKGSYSIKRAYKPGLLLSKCLRYIIPFIPAFIVGILLHIFGKHESFTMIGVIKDFITGGYGPGA